MKTLPVSLLCLAAGFTLSRLPPSGTGHVAVEAKVPASAAAASPGKSEPFTIPKDFSGKETDGGSGVLRPAAGGDWRAAATAWAEADPEGFYDWLVKRGVPPGMETLRILFSAWVQRDANRAFEAAFNLPEDFQRQKFLLDHMLGEVLKNPGGLAAALKWCPKVEEQINGWGWPGEEWFNSSPPGEIAATLAREASGQGFRSSMMDQFAAFWAGKDHAAAMAWMESLPASLRANAFRGIMKSWGKEEPAAALEYLATQGRSGDRFNAYEPLTALAKTDPKAAVDWWENNLGVADYNSLNRIFTEWCKADAKEARDYALSVEDPTLRRNSLEAWGKAAKSDAVRKAIEEVPDGPDRATLLQALSTSTATYRHEKGSEGAVKQGDDLQFLLGIAEKGGPSVTPGLIGNISMTYAYRDPAAAFARTGTVPENLQFGVAYQVLGIWKDNVAAAQAVDQLPDGPFKTTARRALQKSLSDPHR
ncbi:MAG: hypothetical protein V4726_18680 [Verrucomicrobiota bacterium]